MKQCVDEGVLQSFCDGELPEAEAQKVATHVMHCSACEATLGDLNGLTGLVAAAFAPEFQAAVPTERLRRRIDASVANLQTVHSGKESNWFGPIADLFSFRQPQAWGFASLIAVIALATIFGIVYRRQPEVTNVVPKESLAAVNPPVQPVSSSGSATTAQTKPTETPALATLGSQKAPRRVQYSGATKSALPAVAKVKLLPGEKSYLKTIAALDSTIKSANNEPMRPALRAEYERNLALVDHALAAARNAAKRNPSDPDAAEFVFAAYQSKVDLMNTVADARVYNRGQ